jgi:hypothetical protein
MRDGTVDPATLSCAEALLRSVVAVRGWSVDAGSPVWEAAVRACAGVLSLWPGGLSASVLGRYAAVAEEMAAFELPDEWNPAASPSEALKYVVLGTVLFEPVILSLRRLAHVDRGNKLRARRARSALARIEGGSPPLR